MRKAYIEYLVSNKIIPEEQVEQCKQALRNAPEPIGSIALSYGMLSCGDIELILTEQRTNRRQFGAIATEMGMLTHDQVKVLLRVQQLRAATEVTEVLVLAGICSYEEMVGQLGRFLTEADVTSMDANQRAGAA